MPNRPISTELANEMIKNYLSYMTDHGINMEDQTHCVEFSSNALLGWMGSVSAETDQFRLCFGRYPDSHPYAGRLTVIVWPYKNGQPAIVPPWGLPGGDPCEEVDPFNEGTLNP
ncbi:MAG TPA: hypothetical protein VHM26_03080 [Chitinophagaceae bacterium]|jgi:hypothetical protein|nr:hypothetical protein [Chitinophagaceae bacterium]